MKKAEIPKLSYGDRVEITYKRISTGPVPLPDTIQEVGYFVDFLEDCIELSRLNPAFVFGKKEDLPAREKSIKDSADPHISYSLRNKTLESGYYLIKQIIKLEKF